VVNADQVPREHCSPDEKKIRAYMNYAVKTGKDPEIPGVTFHAKKSVEAR
jgi:hypothetical protein